MKPFYAVLSMLGASAFFAQATCPPYPNCLYVTPVNVTFTVSTSSVTYQDEASLPRTISFAIRTPNGLAGPLPVVIWSHGGLDGNINPLAALSEWGELTARAGYISVGIAHAPRPAFSLKLLAPRSAYPTARRFTISTGTVRTIYRKSSIAWLSSTPLPGLFRAASI